MAQYDPIVVKAGIPTIVGTDTLHCDLNAKAGLTTTAVVSGDACQMNGDNVLAKAVNTSAAPIVGIYDGVSGSIVRSGIVVATMATGVVLANGDAVYLSAYPGKLTNVKPTENVIHELGVVVDAASSKILLQQKPAVTVSVALMGFDARSSWLLQGDTPPAAQGEQQAFPSTAASLIAALGSPAGWVAADIAAIYQADTASPLVDSLGLGPNLVAAGVGVLTGRECVGLPGTSFNSKVGVECVNNMGGDTFRAPLGAEAFGSVPAGTIFSVAVVYRYGSNAVTNGNLVGHGGSNPRWWLYNLGNDLRLHLEIPGFLWTADAVGAAPYDNSWHVAFAVIDDVAHTIQLFTDVADSAPVAYAGAIQDLIARFAFFWNASGSGTYSALAYVACCTKALTSAMRQSFWRSFNLNEFNTPVAYTRAGPLIAPITASRVACYGENQPAVGFNTNFAGTDNLLKSGTVCEDGISFLGIGSTDLSTWTDSNTTHAAGDGPSGMRDASRITMLANWALGPGGNYLYTPGGGANLAGATNVSFYVGARVKQATNGTTARLGATFTGDGGGSESFLFATSAATPADWELLSGAQTPLGATHTAIYYIAGAALTGNDVDFAEPYAIQNRAADVLAHRRVALGAAAATATPSVSITNVANARYSPVRGRLRVRIAGWQQSLLPGTVFSAGLYSAAGNLSLYTSAAALYLEIFNTVPAAIVSIGSTGGFMNATERILVVQWDATLGTASVMEGATVVMSASVAPWATPVGAVAPLYVGGGVPGFGAIRANVALLEIFNV
jgi:hypothetical protein